MIKINLIKNKIINYNYINFITFMHYKVTIFHNNKPIFIIIYFIINNTINKTTNLKRKFIINKILIFIINKSIEHNLIFNIIFNNITFYKVATFNNYIYILFINVFIITKNITTKIIFIINYKTNKNIIFNTNSTFIISYKVALSYNNTLIIL